MLLSPAAIGVATLAVVVVLVFGLVAAVEAWRENVSFSGFSVDPTRVAVAVGGEPLSIPANMVRTAKARGGGPTQRVELALHWPTLAGFSEDLADAFRIGPPGAPIVYATIAPREMALDSTGRLESVYAHFFVGRASPGPSGLIGRQLSEESGYGGEVVFFSPVATDPFVARCLATAGDEVPATCLRDVNFGRGLTLAYRFDAGLLADWRALDVGVRTLAAGFLVP